MSQGYDCLVCGACCGHFRVSFYWAEADDAPGGTVPAVLTEQIAPHRRAMCGTTMLPVRCVALSGSIGEAVICSIYDRRPTPCRDFEPGSLGCREARLAHGIGEPLPSPRVA